MEDLTRAYCDDLAAYALGALDQERMREIEARLETDLELRAELEELQESASSLALLSDTKEPPRGLRARLLRRFDLELQARRTVSGRVPAGRPGFWSRLRPRLTSTRIAYLAPATVVAAVAASVISIVAFNSLVGPRIDAIQGQVDSEAASREITSAQMQAAAQTLAQSSASQVEAAKQELNQKTDSKLAEAQAELDALKRTVGNQARIIQMLTSEGTASTWLAGQGQAPDASAVLASNRTAGQQGMLWVNGLPQLPEGQQYQLWLSYGLNTWSPGTFNVEPNGSALIEVDLPQVYVYPLSVAVTIEPDGGSTRPTGPNVLTPLR